MTDRLTQYYRCPEHCIRFALKGSLSTTEGYFKFGDDTTCWGNSCEHEPPAFPTEPLWDAGLDISIETGIVHLPFDPSQVADNLRCELYVREWRSRPAIAALAKAYYFARPILPDAFRRFLQRLYFRGWDKQSFPRWPVDCSVDNLFERLLLLSLKSGSIKQIPFIWFWPEGASGCAVMTHDVETEAGRNFCPRLMDIDDSFGIKASFQIVPEQRYAVDPEFLALIRKRGFELVVHDLNHDGHLYRNRQEFLARAAKINSYREQYGATGFRSGVLYRKQLWYDALRFSYDMSVPNVAHLEPQRGGCCTVMPYFIGNILELPVTTIQDYTLFHILKDYSIDLWKRQIELILEKHGLISFIVHPDYIVAPREQRVLEALLGYLARVSREDGVWITTPGEVDRWWRQRAGMRLMETATGWQIEGAGKERARVAYASEREGRIVYALQPQARVAAQ